MAAMIMILGCIRIWVIGMIINTVDINANRDIWHFDIMHISGKR